MTKKLERLTDMEIAMRLAFYVENPCGIEVGGKQEDIRRFYLMESRKILPKLTNPYAIEFLQNILDKYS